MEGVLVWHGDIFFYFHFFSWVKLSAPGRWRWGFHPRKEQAHPHHWGRTYPGLGAILGGLAGSGMGGKAKTWKPPTCLLFYLAQLMHPRGNLWVSYPQCYALGTEALVYHG